MPQSCLCFTMHTAPTIDVIVWGAIANNTWSPLVLIRGIVTTQWYLLPFLQRLPGAIFKQDNARHHTTRVSQDYLHTVTTLPWPV
ncbi:transposable element Tcb2 transposase [Trichonephila clavipes]|nr:transposable element Tcb2 transposase [Trichonephila clavipes]